MGSARTLVNVTITDVSDKPPTYVACPQCYAKLHDYYCDKCRRRIPPCDVTYRYCLVVDVNDVTTQTSVTVFGSSVNTVLGGSAKQIHRLVERCGEAMTWHQVLSSCLVGRQVILGIKTRKSFLNATLAAILKNLTNHHGNHHHDNVIATQIYAVDNQSRTFYDRLETKLKENDSVLSPPQSLRRVELLSCERVTRREHFILRRSGRYARVSEGKGSPECPRGRLEGTRGRSEGTRVPLEGALGRSSDCTTTSVTSSFLSSLDSYSGRSHGYGADDLDSEVSSMSINMTAMTLDKSRKSTVGKTPNINENVLSGKLQTPNFNEISTSENVHGAGNFTSNNSCNRQSLGVAALTKGINFEDSMTDVTMGPDCESDETRLPITNKSSYTDLNDCDNNKSNFDSNPMLKQTIYSIKKNHSLDSRTKTELDNSSVSSDDSDIILKFSAVKKSSKVERCAFTSQSSVDSIPDSAATVIDRKEWIDENERVSKPQEFGPHNTNAQESQKSSQEFSEALDMLVEGVSFSPWESASDCDFEDNNNLEAVPDSENLWEFLDRCDDGENMDNDTSGSKNDSGQNSQNIESFESTDASCRQGSSEILKRASELEEGFGRMKSGTNLAKMEVNSHVRDVDDDISDDVVDDVIVAESQDFVRTTRVELCENEKQSSDHKSRTENNEDVVVDSHNEEPDDCEEIQYCVETQDREKTQNYPETQNCSEEQYCIETQNCEEEQYCIETQNCEEEKYCIETQNCEEEHYCTEFQDGAASQNHGETSRNLECETSRNIGCGSQEFFDSTPLENNKIGISPQLQQIDGIKVLSSEVFMDKSDSEQIEEESIISSIVDGSADLFDCSEDLFDTSYCDDNSVTNDEQCRKNNESVINSEDMFGASRTSPLASQCLFSQASQDYRSPKVSPKVSTSTPVCRSASVKKCATLLKKALRNRSGRVSGRVPANLSVGVPANISGGVLANMSSGADVSGDFSGDMFD